MIIPSLEPQRYKIRGKWICSQLSIKLGSHLESVSIHINCHFPATSSLANMGSPYVSDVDLTYPPDDNPRYLTSFRVDRYAHSKLNSQFHRTFMRCTHRGTYLPSTGDSASTPPTLTTGDDSTDPSEGFSSRGYKSNFYGSAFERAGPRTLPSSGLRESIDCFFRFIHDCDETPRALEWPAHAVEHLVSIVGIAEPPSIPAPYYCSCGVQVDHGTWEPIFRHALKHISAAGGRQLPDTCLLDFLREHDIISDEERTKADFQTQPNQIYESATYTTNYTLIGIGGAGHGSGGPERRMSDVSDFSDSADSTGSAVSA
jgi:hypothetical protein